MTTVNSHPSKEIKVRPAWRVPGAVYLLVTASLGRLPQAMGALALVRFVRDGGGSYDLAGAATAAYVLAGAVGQPMLGRLADRFGPSRVLWITALVGAGSLCALVLVGTESPVALLLCAALAGLATPPLESCLRALWPRMMQEGPQLNTAFSMDVGAQELLYVVAPMITSFGILLFGTSFNVIFMAAILLLGTLAFAWHPLGRRQAAELSTVTRSAPLRIAAFRRLVVLQFLIGVPIGTLAIIVTTYGEYHGSDIAAGILLGINGVGAFAGTIWIGKRPFRAPLAKALKWTAICFGLSFLAVAFIGLPFPLFMAAAFVAGIGFPMALTQVFHLVARSVPLGSLNEANAWVVSAVGVGIAGGTWLSGMIIGTFGSVNGAILTVGLAAVAAVLGGLFAPAASTSR